jgi:uncharacterized protein (DUF1501 family)
MNRRRVLQLSVASAGLGVCGRLFAAPAGPRLLLVFLRGGYDCCNLLIPYSSSLYYETRPNIAVPRPDAGSDTGALALDPDWALAPAVRATLGKLFAAGQASFIPFAGTNDLSRSHFETQDDIELGQPAGTARDYRSGFLGRLAGTLTGVDAIAFTDNLPLIFQDGAQHVPNLSLKNVGKPPFDERQTRVLIDMYAGTPLQAEVADGLELRQVVAGAMADEMQAANRSAMAPKGFELEAERMAKLMRDTYRLGFIDVGGWDTHVGQGAATGALASGLDSLGRGLEVFAQSLGGEWNNTVVVVLSEFGRTFRENGDRGTDHGHGTVYWVLGGAVRGGRIAGAQQRLERGSLFQDRDYPVLNEYRAVLGGLFRSLWSLTPAQSARVFPGTSPQDLGLV